MQLTAAIQNNMRHDLLIWNKKNTRHQAMKWDELVFNLSLARAMNIPWVKLGAVLGQSRTNCRESYRHKLYPDREDIVRYAAAAPRDERAINLFLEDIRYLKSSYDSYTLDLYEKVNEFRQLGASWTTIAKALGTTRQAAQQRFSQDR